MKIKTTYLEIKKVKDDADTFASLPATWQEEINLVIDTANQLEHFLVNNQSFVTIFASNKKSQNVDLLISINKLLSSRLRQLFDGDKKVLDEFSSAARKIHFMVTNDNMSYVKEVGKTIREVSKTFTLYTGRTVCPLVGKK